MGWGIVSGPCIDIFVNGVSEMDNFVICQTVPGLNPYGEENRKHQEVSGDVEDQRHELWEC
jgi:hypothetical protein